MAYVTPNNIVRILSGIPIERNYEHTLYFSTEAAQTNYFLSKAKYSFTDMSHVRVTKPGNTIKVDVGINDLYDCNYLMIQNRNSANGKTFYCFIDNVTYVNEGVSEIDYTIDVLQTWFFNFNLNACYVERQHALFDAIGDNIIPEPVNIGDYEIQSEDFFPRFQSFHLVVITTADMNSVGGLAPSASEFIGGTLNNCQWVAYPLTNITSTEEESVQLGLQHLLNTLNLFGRLDTVINLFICPTICLPHSGVIYFHPNGVTPSGYSYDSQPSTGDSFSSSLSRAKIDTVAPSISPTYSDFTPKNNKLYTFPYCYLQGSTTQGDTVEYKYEFFDSIIGKAFEIYCDFSAKPSLICVPVGYGISHGVFLEGAKDWSRCLSLKDFPSCIFATNDFTAKLVQGAIRMAITAGAYSVGGLAGSMVASNIPEPQPQIYSTPIAQWNAEQRELEHERNKAISESTNKATKLANTIGNIGYNAMTSPPSKILGSGNMSHVTNTLGFTFRGMRIKTQYARIIDNFFTMYGYAQKRVMVPNIHTRQRWTYIKTTNCTLNGSIPNDDADRICNIFNSGITYWVNPSEVGDYTLNNPPLQG